MKEYLKNLISRVCWQFFFFLGRFIILGGLLFVVSSSIRGNGASAFGNAYYYAVMPGVACHETGHAIGCLCTGRRIVEFAPFKPHGDTLGYVLWDPGEKKFSAYLAAFVVGTAPLWFGCIVVCLLCLVLTKTKLISDNQIVSSEPFLSGIPYWRTVIKSSFGMMKSILKNIKLNSLYKFFLLYLLFCIISEMIPSPTDLSACLPGFLLLIVLLLVLNAIPFIGKKISTLTCRIQPFFIMIHSAMLFVLILDLVIFLCLALPLGFLL